MANAYPTYTYRVTDPVGITIYVGQTRHISTRMRQHAKESIWASLARMVHPIEWPTKTMALMAERALINENRATVTNTTTGRALILETSAWQRMFDSVDELADTYGIRLRPRPFLHTG